MINNLLATLNQTTITNSTASSNTTASAVDNQPQPQDNSSVSSIQDNTTSAPTDNSLTDTSQNG